MYKLRLSLSILAPLTSSKSERFSIYSEIEEVKLKKKFSLF